MKTRFPAFAALLLFPVTAYAQGPTIEIGSGLGASILTNGGSLTHIGVPGAGIVGQAPLYVNLFFGRGVLIQPEVSFNILSGGGETLTTLGVAGHLGYTFSGAAANSAYASVGGAVQYADSDFGSNSEFGVGARVGYRVLVNTGFAIGFEGGFRRWFDSEVNEITIAIRLGGIVSAP